MYKSAKISVKNVCQCSRKRPNSRWKLLKRRNKKYRSKLQEFTYTSISDPNSPLILDNTHCPIKTCIYGSVTFTSSSFTTMSFNYSVRMQVVKSLQC